MRRLAQRPFQPEAFKLPPAPPRYAGISHDSTTLLSRPRLCTHKGRARASSSQVPSTAEAQRESEWQARARQQSCKRLG